MHGQERGGNHTVEGSFEHGEASILDDTVAHETLGDLIAIVGEPLTGNNRLVAGSGQVNLDDSFDAARPGRHDNHPICQGDGLGDAVSDEKRGLAAF
jgi:hypothetical protein